MYSLNILLDENALKESFQKTINKLNMAKYQLEKDIAKDEEINYEMDEPIPDYTISVPISFQLPKISRHCLRRSRIGMFCGHFFSHAPQEMHAEALSPVSQGFFPMELYRFSAAVSRL